MKFGKIELSDWTNQPQPDLAGYPPSGDRHLTFKTPENQWKIGISLCPHPYTPDTWYVMFYHQFCDLNEAFPSIFEAKDIEAAKEYVDQFLIRMSKLTAFL